MTFSSSFKFLAISILLCALSLGLGAGDAWAQSTFTNTAGGDWNTSANWSAGIPTAGVTANLTTDTGTSSYIVTYTSPMSAPSFGALNLGFGSTVTDADTVTLSITSTGFNTTGANAISGGGILSVGTGGVYADSSTLTLSEGGVGSGQPTVTNNGTLTVTGNTLVTNGVVNLQSGTSTFTGGITLANNPITGQVVKVSGGTNSLGNFIDGRDTTGGTSTTTGLLVSGGTATATEVLLNTAGSWANTAVSGGSLTITGGSLAFIVDDSTAGNGRGATLSVSGTGVLNDSDTTNGLIITNGNNTPGTATFSGGTANLGKITLLGPSVTSAASNTTTATLLLNGGTVYVGAGGIGLGTSTPGAAVATINLSTGILGASADWSSSLPMNLLNNITIQAADASATAHNITLSGALTGTGILTKTGAGTLTLSSASNAYTGSTTVNAGTLAISAGTYGAATVSSGTLALTGGTFTGATGINSGGTVNVAGTVGAAAVTVASATATTSSVNVGAGGSYSLSSLTFTTIAGFISGIVNNTGGTLAVSGLTSPSAVATANGYTINLSGGTSNFNGIDIDDTNTAINISGGTNSLGAVEDSRDASGASTTTGLVITNGTTTASSLDFGGGSRGGQSVGNINMSGGSLTVTGNFDLGNTTTNAFRGGNLTVTGGTLTSTGSNGLVVVNADTAESSVVFSGGTSTFQGITLIGSGVDASAPIASTIANVTLSGSGILYLGSGGIVNNGQNLGSGLGSVGNFNLKGGTLGATADWSSSTPFSLSTSAVTIQAADSGGTAHNINLSGVLSGTVGGLTKTGAGILTLSGASTYTPATIVSAGTLNVTGSLSGSSSVTVTNATLEGAGGRFTNIVNIGNGVNAAGSAIFSAHNATTPIGTFATGAFTMKSDGVYQLNINSSSVTSDLTSVSGLLTLNSGAQLSVTDLGSTTLALNTRFDILNYSTESGTFSGLADGSNLTVGSNIFRINYGTAVANEITLTDVLSVPEPSTWALLLAGSMALCFIRRRQMSAKS